MTLDLLNNVFLLHLALKKTKGILQRLALLQSNFRQTHHLPTRIQCISSSLPHVYCAPHRLNANSSLIEVLTRRSNGAHLAYLIGYNESSEKTMKNTKFVVKVNRGGTLKPEYVQRIDRTPIQMTSDRKLALLMGRLTAEDAVKSIQTLRCSPELVSVQVSG